MERRDVSGPVDPRGRVPDSFDDPRFPKVVGRTRPFLSALEIADPVNNPVGFKSASRMEAGE